MTTISMVLAEHGIDNTTIGVPAGNNVARPIHGGAPKYITTVDDNNIALTPSLSDLIRRNSSVRPHLR
ncbi:hypothetical protein CAEBREN_04061 [Caenorhabditis brenneri]|uniref:Uncharacterized protein n=1 Tax=Caenorhabditis brenneri TaxID=135651 RepID=G0NZJ6_CAEBE|nr:hypothetical protein CAEBREN_04061 [Caenorhabditis brenneri]